MNSKFFKCCAVPLCKSTSIRTPEKVFVHVPNKKIIRDKWLKLAWRNPNDLVTNAPLYFCEDHFDLPNDMENYMQYHLMGSVSQVRMKPGCMPHKFTCQPDRKTRTSDTTEQPYIAKKQRTMILEECKNDFEGKCIVTEQSILEGIASGSSVQQNVEEVPQSPRVLAKSIQVHIQKPYRSKANCGVYIRTHPKSSNTVARQKQLSKKKKEIAFLLNAFPKLVSCYHVPTLGCPKT